MNPGASGRSSTANFPVPTLPQGGIVSFKMQSVHVRARVHVDLHRSDGHPDYPECRLEAHKGLQRTLRETCSPLRTFPPTSSQSCTCSSSQLGSRSLSHSYNTVCCSLSDICRRAPTPPRPIVQKRVAPAHGVALPASAAACDAPLFPSVCLTPRQGGMSPLTGEMSDLRHRTTCLMVPIGGIGTLGSAQTSLV